MNKKELVGYITVDAGIIQVGDPCYGNRDEFNDHKNWLGYIEDTKMNEMDTHVVVPHENIKDIVDKETFGKSIIVGKFGGDGAYPVYIKKNKYGLVTEVIIKFN